MPAFQPVTVLAHQKARVEIIHTGKTQRTVNRMRLVKWRRTALRFFNRPTELEGNGQQQFNYLDHKTGDRNNQ
jgi:hypothetical protein